MIQLKPDKNMPLIRAYLHYDRQSLMVFVQSVLYKEYNTEQLRGEKRYS